MFCFLRVGFDLERACDDTCCGFVLLCFKYGSLIRLCLAGFWLLFEFA